MMFATASLRFFINDKMFKFVSREHSKFTQSSQSGEKDKKNISRGLWDFIIFLRLTGAKFVFSLFFFYAFFSLDSVDFPRENLPKISF